MTIRPRPEALYKLEITTDNPKFEGFALEEAPSVLGRESLDEDITPGFEASESVRVWSQPRLADVWKRPRVEGRVASYNDFPGIDMVLPAFSRRACDVLRDFLEPNGELLPLDSPVGEYYFYNITTVVDAIDLTRSKCDFWCDPPTTAVDVEYFAFHDSAIRGKSIFRIIELPLFAIVSSQFVERVQECGLQGFQFQKIWPFSPGTNWRVEAKREGLKPDGKHLKQNTVILLLSLADAKPSPNESTRFEKLEDDLDAQLAVSSLNSSYFGRYEGHEILNNQIRVFISCPDAEQLVQKLLPWLHGVNWPGKMLLMKRYGPMRDTDAREEVVELFGKQGWN